MSAPFLTYKTYLKSRHGEPLFRVPIDFNSGCPHRNTDGSGGCTFCAERGARAVQTQDVNSVEDQIKTAIKFARNRYRAKKYMAYIQAFSASFGPARQKEYLQLFNSFNFSAISFGTRPDSLTPQAYTFLEKLNQTTETWVELGVQTVHDKTLKRINRCHDWNDSKTAIKELHKRGIRVAVHIILALPGETSADFKQTAETLATLPIDAIKIHNLHIEKGTQLAKEYAQNPFPLLMEHDFAEEVIAFIRRIPAHIPIMRLTTDTLATELIAPKWQMDKNQFKDYLIQQMICREYQQGDLCKTQTPTPNPSSIYKILITEDQSVTFWNPDYKEHYHTPAGARLEAEQKYISPSHLDHLLDTTSNLHLLDICFGLGYNSLCALNHALKKERATLHITALEMDRRVVKHAAQNITTQTSDPFDWKNTLTNLYQHQQQKIQNHTLKIRWGDARHTITKQKPNQFDLVFLDAFSTQRNSELWTVEFFKKIKRLMKPNALLLTYCAAIPVRAGLLEAGFFVGETKPVGRNRGGTLATQNPDLIAIPLNPNEQKTIQTTTRGIPYHDPFSVWTNKEILRHRQNQILKTKNSFSSTDCADKHRF